VRKIAPGRLVGVQAVVSEKEITRLRIKGEATLSDFSWASDFLEREQVPIKEVHITEVSDDPNPSRASFIVSSPNIYGWDDIQAKMEHHLGEAVQFDTHLSALSLIGEGLNRDSATLIEVITLLEHHSISIAGVTTTSFRISLLVPREKIDESVRLCHGKWIADV
jgi:aspartokinase